MATVPTSEAALYRAVLTTVPKMEGDFEQGCINQCSHDRVSPLQGCTCLHSIDVGIFLHDGSDHCSSDRGSFLICNTGHCSKDGGSMNLYRAVLNTVP